MAQWIRHRPTEPGIAGSSPAGVICLLHIVDGNDDLDDYDDDVRKKKKSLAPWAFFLFSGLLLRMLSFDRHASAHISCSDFDRVS